MIGYFDPHQPLADLTGNLPHWRQEGVTYFVTFRLADSVPQTRLDLWRREQAEWLARHPEPHDEPTRHLYYERFVARFQKWLDGGYGECVLARPDIREIVAQALSYFEGSRYLLREWVIMPNHVHAVVSPTIDHGLSDILHSWKSYSANVINRLLGRTGPLWHKESFDHIVRGPDSLERIERYVHDNPRDLPTDAYTLHCIHK
jgi:REP element-mobilizing transposase RayT